MKHRLHPTRLAALALAAVLCAGAAAAQAQTYRVIHYFTGGAGGWGPSAGLIFDSAGNLYGTTGAGGDAGCYGSCGVVFELSPGSQGWSETVLYTFTGGSDGGYPLSGLIFDANGNLYGTADVGGLSGCEDYGCGVVFEVSPGSDGWAESVLFDFSGATLGNPESGVVFDKAGNLYGVLPIGPVYQLTHRGDEWDEKTLYRTAPCGTPTLDGAGNLYGTTSFGNGSGGFVWELLHGSWKEKTLHLLDGGPCGGVVFDKHGNLYGTTSYGGKYQVGFVFRLTPEAKGKWKETVLYNFKGGTDGNAPLGEVALDKAGNIYGTTEGGGNPSCAPPLGCGTVFKLTPEAKGKWKETVLHQFNGTDGRTPSMEQLVLDEKGNIYGTTALGGKSGCGYGFGCGVVFEITP